jgi:hypothetical protein
MSQAGSSRVTGFDSLKDRLATGGATLLFFADEPQPNCSALEQVKEIENVNTLERSEGFLFRGSTDPVAKERLFQERFTCFSTGLTRCINNTGNATPFCGGTCAQNLTALRLIFSVYTALSSSYSVEALPTR